MRTWMVSFTAACIAGCAPEGHVQVAEDLLAALDDRPFDAEYTRSFFADDYIDHDRSPQTPADIEDREGLVGTFTELSMAFPTGRHDVHFVDPMGSDRVVARWTFSGRHEGPLFGIPASGNEVDFNGLDVYRIQNGKIAEMWHIQDLVTLFNQLDGNP